MRYTGTAIKVRVVGVDNLRAVMNKASAAVRQGVRVAIADSTLRIRTAAKRRVQRNKRATAAANPERRTRPGNLLAQSIRADFYYDGTVGVVSTNTPYAKFVEYGTGERGASGSVNEDSVGPLPAGYKHGPKKGMQARPFMYPSYLEERDRFLSNLAAVVGMEIRRVK